MNDIRYNLHFDKLCNILQLGEIVGVPEAISGGLLHRMYGINTDQGKYAVKALNPQIMLRPAVLKNYLISEQIANAASNNIPALPAKKFNSSSVQDIDNQFYLVFDWVDGKSLKPNEIRNVHCEKIGAILADIHRTDFSTIEIANDRTDNVPLTDWNHYLHKGEENNTVWFNELLEIIDNLYDWNSQARQSAKLLSSVMVISHRDLDSKNVMWNEDNPLIIDWESAGYISPMQDLTETAIYWSEDETGNIDEERFLSFINGYKKRYGMFQANWRIVLLNGFSSKLDWLEYNLKRSLGIEYTDEAEQQMGTAQVSSTLKAIRRYSEMISELEKWLYNEN